MGEIVTFESNGKTAEGYLAVPDSTGPAIVVIQEWWGLVDHIKDVCDRFAREGFVALAPDLYHGRSTKEPDEAGKLLMSLELEEAGKDMAGAVRHLVDDPIVEPKKVGAVGFCAGGNLALQLAAIADVSAVAPFYPYPLMPDPDWSKFGGPVLMHVASEDQAPSPQRAEEMVAALRAAGKEAEMHVYEGADHAFFNDTRADTYKPEHAKLAWERTIAFFREHLR